MEEAHRLTALWDEVNRLDGEKQHKGLFLAATAEAFAVEKRIVAMRAVTPEEALVQLRIAASYFDLACDPDLWDAIHKLVWSAVWALNTVLSQGIPFADKYNPPRMDPEFVEPGRRGAHLDRPVKVGAA